MTTTDQTIRRIDPAEDAKRRWAANPGKCINEHCCSKGKHKRHHSRGLCHNCYVALRALIIAKTDPRCLSWEDAERLGRCLMKQAVRRKRFPLGPIQAVSV
jgi:hypothetical protein